MLLYNKVIDPYHTLFRMVAICRTMTVDILEYDRLRIYDFLLAFPSYTADVRLPKSLTKKKNMYKKYKNSYNNYDARTSFNNMQSIQKTVILHLEKLSILEKIIDRNEFVIQKENIYYEFEKLINESESIDHNLLEFLNNDFNKLSLYGNNGLKDRTKLLEFKYDPV